ncbi:hypothetical protein ACWGDE_21695 [Streptomyces sp. NPDC054956]
MNDSPGWATPGSSPSEGEGSHETQPSSGASGGPKWSAEQPPPGQWSSPTPGPTPPSPQQPPAPPQQGAGWGSYGGGQQAPYGGSPGNWGNQAPALKPGVIPLRPLGMSEILDGAVATMRKHWRAVLPITLVVAVAIQLIIVLIQKFVFADVVLETSDTATLDEQLSTLGSSMGVLSAEMFVQLVGGIVATALLTMVFSRAVLGQGSSVGDAWRDSRSQLPRLFGLTLAVTLGSVLLAGVLILPGALAGNTALIVLGALVTFPLLMWLWVRYSLASPALMLEKAPVLTSLTRSSKLVRGSWWRIFGITFLTNLITGFISAIIVFPLTLVGLIMFGGGLEALSEGTGSNNWGYLIVVAIGGIIGLTITMPMQAGVNVLLYVDQRIRREALDLELARAAGIENYGTTTPPTGG